VTLVLAKPKSKRSIYRPFHNYNLFFCAKPSAVLTIDLFHEFVADKLKRVSGKDHSCVELIVHRPQWWSLLLEILAGEFLYQAVGDQF